MDDVLRSVAAYWDDRAATFDDEPDHGLATPSTRAAWTRRLDDWLPDPPARVADLGCGTGSLAVLLTLRGYQVGASDLSPAMVERTRHKAAGAGVDLDVRTADAAHPGLPARSVDVVLVRHLAWTLPDPASAIATWASLLREGGRLVMVEGRWATPALRQRRHDEGDVEPGGYGPVHEDLPWYGGVPAETLVPLLEQTFRRVEHHDLTGDDDLWGRPVADERYAVVAHRG